jgi:cyclopropane fatty-acyl-phospholipid synthase-like methyltransferase
VEWICGNAADLDLRGCYCTVVAGDLVEHMTPAELDRLYAKVAKHLEPTGLFIVHTFPNKWFYQYDYPRRRRLAARLGAYLPPQPRTRYEKLMHINEQSPRFLKQQLGACFEHVLR